MNNPTATNAFANIDVLIQAIGEPGTTADDRKMFLRAVLTTLRTVAEKLIERIDALTKVLP